MGSILPSSRSPSPPPPPPPPPLQKTTVLFSEQTSQLPARLPSVREIESSRNVLKELRSRRIVRVGQHYVVKYGWYVKPIEGENSLVPRLLAIYQRPGKDASELITYLIMEYLSARPLSELWSIMGETEKLEVIDTLREALQILRSIPPPDYFGSLGMTALNDDIFNSEDEPTPTRNGPFKTESAVIHAVILRYRAEGGERLRHKADYYRDVLPQVLQGNGKPVFTHGNLQRKNIMIGSGGEVMIIDWAPSGWYPIWWEYAIAMVSDDWYELWYRYVPKWMSEFPHHYAWFHMLRREIWC
ncbi:kinase-like domain-containing protein [Xylaria sp. FL1777]|nr:kinase-like domain-containing protein [Xylaria sp. FL1777]